MPVRLSDRASEAYAYPLLLRHLLHASLAAARDRQILYGDRYRGNYGELRKPIGRVATGHMRSW